MTSSYPSTPSIASENTPNPTTNPCTFPALQLHDIRRQLVESLPFEEIADDPRAVLIRAIDYLHTKHERQTACLCWLEVLTPEMQEPMEVL